MGRRKRRKHHKARKKRAGKHRAGRMIQRGPLRISQQDSMIVWENLSTPQQHEEILKRAAEMYPEVCKEITNKVRLCREIVSAANPLHVLMYAYWNFLHSYMGAAPEESKTTREQATSVRVLEYTQMLIAGVDASAPANPFSDKEFARLRRAIEALYDLLNTSYFITRSAHDRALPNYNDELDQFRVLTEMNWLNVRGNRYLSQDVPHLKEFLLPQSEILHEVFGLTALEIVAGVEKLLQAFSRGLHDAITEFDSFRTDTLVKIDELFAKNDTGGAELPELMKRVVKENNWEARRDRVFGRLFGTDLCDVIKVSGWPASFANQLAIAPGADPSFDQGDRASWPTQFSLSRLTPFMSLDGKPYFFHVHGLTDNLYRAIERLVKNAKPSYSEHWNTKQKNATETAALRFLNQILPGPKSLSPVWYWADDRSTDRRWTESDGVLIYDRTLFVIEAKGGAYTPKPPGSYIDAHINSMKKLVRDAIGQAKRFQNTLMNKGALELYDEHRNLLCTLNREQFDHVVLCCVTLDHIDHLASHAEDLKTIGVDFSVQPVWCVSIDDLRVYADIFQNPLMFLDFLCEHMDALKSRNLRVMDEMDHLGLYLEHNRYVMRFEKMGAVMVMGPHGYRDKLDAYYSTVWRGKPARPPVQEMPLRIKQIIDLLAQTNREGRTAAAQSILCMDGETRQLMNDNIEKCLALQDKLARPRPLSTHGDVRITVFVDQKQSIATQFDAAVHHAIAVMKLQGESDRVFFHLSFSAHGLLENVRWKMLNTADLEAMDPKTLDKLCEQLRRTRQRLMAEQDHETGTEVLS